MMRLYLLGLTFIFTFGALCQKKINIAFTTEDYKIVKKNIQTSFKDKSSALKYLSEFQSFAIKQGYLLASIDSIRTTESSIIADFYAGEKFNSVQLTITDEDLLFLKKETKYREKYLSNIPFRPKEINQLIKSIHESTLSNGYPFSKVYLEKIEFQKTKLTAKLVIEEGKLYTFTDIHIKGDSSISSIFISNLIDIKKGQVYDESKLRLISKKISQLSFIKEIKAHELLFTVNGVELYLYLQSNPVSSVNGAIGLQPDPNTKRIGLTGELNLKLLNILKRGESMQLSWRSIQPLTQSMNGKLNYPFLFKSPFGLDGQFQLYKRDTTFLELKSTFGVQYFLKGGNFLKVFYQNNSSNILSGASNNPQFSNLSTVRTNAYGFAILRRQLDYLPNPSKGLGIHFEIAVGNRKSLAIDSTIPIKSTTYRSAFQVDWFISINPRNVIRLANASEFYYAEEFFQNEVFRFGGQGTLRGFNEEELYGTYRSVFTFEYRYLLDKNSHLFVFFDQGFYENNAVKYYNDKPFGFGAGVSFGTNLGIFSISYALGKQFSNPILLSNGKVHFGYIAYF